MIRIVEDAGLTMMIGFVHRFRNEVLEAKRLIEEGVLGTPATALDKFCSLGGPHPPAWVWEQERAGGGVLMYGGIHAVDRILWLLDTTAEAVYARSHAYTAWAGDVEDGLVARARRSRTASRRRCSRTRRPTAAPAAGKPSSSAATAPSACALARGASSTSLTPVG